MVVYGLDQEEVRLTLRIQKPDSECEMLKLLNEFDARRTGSSKIFREKEVTDMHRWKHEHRLKESRNPS